MTWTLKRAITIGCIIGAVRVADLWVVYYLASTSQQTIAILPLVLVLCPEGLLFPYSPDAGVSWALLMSVLLMLGSIGLVIGSAAMFRKLHLFGDADGVASRT
jgi:hypothetical protein